MKTNTQSTFEDLLDGITPLDQAKTDAKMILSAKIIDAMKLKNWKKKDLLAAVGRDNASVITKWLSGTQNFTVDTLVELEHALGISLLSINEKKERESTTYHIVVHQPLTIFPFRDLFDEMSAAATSKSAIKMNLWNFNTKIY